MAAINAWKRKLLDLSMRNRLLNFRTTRVSTVTVVDEQPAEVFRYLALNGKSMKFAAAAQAEIEAATTTGPEDELEIGKAPATQHQLRLAEFAPYERENLHHRHRDGVLQTSASPEQLDRALLRIDAQATATLEEQGVSTLFLALGMLQYRESVDSEEWRRAPLVLLPVALDRKSARAGFTVRASGDDPLVNPAVVELMKSSFGIELPDLPAPDQQTDDYDLQALLSATARAVRQQPDWKVTNEIYLGLFSFQKFVMYKDLEANSAALAQHRLIQRIATREGNSHQGLPPDIREAPLDELFPPESSHQVIDADASQLRALLAAGSGHDLVIEGPPGTGKSQTITNLIAQALGKGNSVLFVAEKMAALEVVAANLERVGLSEFCLEIHSSKANKRSVIEQIKTSLDASLSRPAVSDRARGEIFEARMRTTEYVRSVHAPFGANVATPYQAYGEIALLAEAPRLRFDIDAPALSAREVGRAVRELEELAAAAEEVEPVAEHPYRDSQRTYYTSDQLEEVLESARWVLGSASELCELANAASAELGLPPIRTPADVDVVAEIAETLHRSPGAPLDVLRSDAWNEPPAEARQLVERGRRIRGLLSEVRTSLREEVTDYDVSEDLLYVERKLEGRLSWLAWLDGRYRAIARKWKGFRLPAFQGGVREQLERMRTVEVLREQRALLAASAGAAAALFGVLWRGETSNWDALDQYIAWVVDYRRVWVTHGLSQRAHELASIGTVDISRIGELKSRRAELLARLDRLRLVLDAQPSLLSEAPFVEIAQRAAELARGWRSGQKWAAFVIARRAVIAGHGLGALRAAEAERRRLAELPAAFRRTFWANWIEAALAERPALREFHGLTHESRVEQFRDLDRQVLQENRAQLKATLRGSIQERLAIEPASSAMPALRREMARNRGHKPIRTTLREAGAAVRSIKRCFMMSPMTVAQLIDGSTPTFDLVVFDEASQLPTEDAVGAVLRGRQLVVVGDPKQLPPTNFFAVANGQVEAQRDEDGNLLFEDTESVLEEFMGVGVPQARLKWHYRSTDESLIAFSNTQFYDSELMTFPSVFREGGAHGLLFEFVPEGIYEGKGVNWIEARRVVDAIVDHAARRPILSLGVGTFSTSQQSAIVDLLEERRRQDPRLDTFLQRRERGGFFVKNLENIQGDERDVIFLSVSYAKARDGRLRYQFGPINQQNGWRRLNVLITRARQEMRVFSSITCDDFHLETTTATGARLLRDFLAYAQRGILDTTTTSAEASVESEFERQVFSELSRRGLQLIPQVGVSSYRIDLGVVDERVPGRFVCGIECDGASYHRSETARDRDRLRAQVLADRGWTIHRVWSTDWFKDRDSQAERLMRLVNETREQVLREQAEPASTSEPATSTAPASEAEARGNSERPASAYRRPEPILYRVTEGERRWMGRSLLAAPEVELDLAVRRVVDTEAPIRLDALYARVAALWGTKAGSRIVNAIRSSLRRCRKMGQIEVRGKFVWAVPAKVVPRSRISIPSPQAEQIAPEEYRAAVLYVLRGGHSLPRPQLVVEVRSVLGFSRTGAKLEEQISAAIDALLVAAMIGEGSTGIALRSEQGS